MILHEPERQLWYVEVMVDYEVFMSGEILEDGPCSITDMQVHHRYDGKKDHRMAYSEACLLVKELMDVVC